MQAIHRLAPSVIKYSTRLYNPARYFGLEFTFKPAEGDEVEVECDEKENLLEIAQSNDVEVKSTCGGGGSCGECIMVFPKDVFDKLPKAGESETALLKKMNAPANARLSCQVKTCSCMNGKVIEVPLILLVSSNHLMVLQTGGSYPYSFPSMNDDLGSEIEKLIYEKYDSLKCGGKPQSHEWTVLSGIVEERGDTKAVIVLTTGTKCVGEHALSADGLIVNDCHAEILCRRCFIRYLLDHLNDDSLIAYDPVSRRCRVRPTVKYHLYVSQSPCGLASEYQQQDGKRLATEIANAKVRASKRRCLESSVVECDDVNHIEKCNEAVNSVKECDNVLNTNEKCSNATHPINQCDDAMHRTGAKYVEADALQLSTKPGRGDRSRSYSCSDKLCMYNHLGYQGGLLSTVLEPVFMHSITISGQWDESTMKRALFERVHSDASSPRFFHRDAPSPLAELEVMKRLDGRKLSASGSSLLWIAPNVSETLIASKGVRLGTNVKKGITEKNRSIVSPSALYAVFGEKCGDERGETYWSTKQRAVAYQKKKSALFPSWSRKDRSLLLFE